MKRNLHNLIACVFVLFILGQNTKAQTVIYSNLVTVLAGTSTTDLAGIYGDSITTTNTGILKDFSFNVYNSASGGNTGSILTASFLISIYDGRSNALLGSFTASADFTSFGGLLPLYYTTVAIDASSFNINLNTTHLFITQQMTAHTGTSNRIGTVLVNPPTVGSSSNTIFISNLSNPAGWYTFPPPNVSNLGYELSVCNSPSVISQTTAAQTQCYGGTFAAITVSATGDGLSYQWYSNASNSNSGGTTLDAANGAQTDSYTPQATASGTTYYYCVVSGTCGADTTDVSGAFLVRDKFRPGNTKGHQTIVYYPFTNDTDYTLLSDDVSEAVWDFTKLHDYYVSDDGFGNVLQTYQDGTAVDAATALANNAYFSLTLNAVSTLSLDSLLFEVGKGGSSDPRGFFIRSSIDGYTSDLITETLPLGSQQAPILHKLLLNASHEGISTVTFRFYLFSPSNSKSIDWRNLKFVYGETGETICNNENPAQINSLSPASGGDGPIAYQWQSSTDEAFTSPTDISSNTTTYDPPTNLTATTWYRRQAKDGACNTTFTSSGTVWKVTVLPVFTAGTIDNTGQNICYNDDPAIIGNTTVASGGDGAITYQWQSSLDAAFTSPTDISSNTSTYDPPANLTATTWYRRQAKDGTCNTTFTTSGGVWKVNVSPTTALTGATSVTQGQVVTYSTPYNAGNSYTWNASHGNPQICFPNRNCLTLTWDFPCGIINPGYVTVTETDPSTGCSATVTQWITIAP